MTNRKLKITDKLGEVEFSELEMSLNDILLWVLKNIEKYGGNSRLLIDEYRHHDYDNECSPCFRLIKERLETDEEVEQRLQKMREYQEKEEFRAYQEFKRLKARFEDI